MRVAVFSTKPYDREFLTEVNEQFDHELVFFEPRLTWQTCPLVVGFPAVCAFVNDQLDAHVLVTLAKQSVRLIAMRCAGFNNVDLRIADQMGLTVTRVPAYSPHAVAEHTVGLMLALNRRLHKAYNRVREGNFALDGLLGFEFYGRTVGVVGTGRIGTIVARIMAAFGCPVVAYDVTKNPEIESFGAKYVSLDELLSQSDVITLHCPLVPETYHLLGQAALAKVKRGIMIVNTSRGALIDTQEMVRALKSGVIGSLGMDVYEEEEELFYQDLSNRVIQDDVFSRMLTFPNVLITGHQAFFTHNALVQIAKETLTNITAFEKGEVPPGRITADRVRSQGGPS